MQKFPQDYEDNSSNIPASTIEFSEAPEDVELTKQMDALGLPLSFQSNKEVRNKMIAGKRKGTHLKLSCGHKEAKDEALEFTRVSEVEIVSPTVLHDNTSDSLCCMSILGQSESYYYDVAVDTSDSQCPAGEDPSRPTEIISDAVFDGKSDLSNNGMEYEFVAFSDVISNEENGKGLSSGNADAPHLPPCWLTDASVDHDKKELGRSLMDYECLEDSSAALIHEQSRRFCNDNSTEEAEVSEIVVLSQNSEVFEHDGADSCGYNVDFGDWRVYWDSFYLRNYFHNIKTGASTWDPPTGMEHLAYDGVADGLDEVIAQATENDDSPSISRTLLNYSKSLEEPPNDARLEDQPSNEVSTGKGVTADSSFPGMTILTANNSSDLRGELHGISASFDDEVTSCLSSDVQEHIGSLTCKITEKINGDENMQIEIVDPATDRMDTQFDSGMKKKKKKARKMGARRKSSNASEELQCQVILEELSANIGKYWCQRYLLFSRFDSGIQMDEEGWFSVTPEPIARHHALRCDSDIIIDCFAGVGGNAIQFAQRCKHVTAIDVDPKKIDYAYHNAAIYGVRDQIDFIKGDFFVLAPKLKADTVFLSPPWGGPDYAKVKTYNIMRMLKPHDGYFLFNTAKKIAHKIVMFLPRNVDLNQLAELSLSADHPWSLEVEKNFLNGKLKAVTAYFSATTVEGNESP
ncbi:uncharacterized protein LOC110643631 isoform X1 [Hevea brasiliensis]|uniref:uncharacterized protein LOC110643631 isoform X1 n=1 Tax=Hevea brasiliensis TaxID=3981 RepID=UPI0025F9E0B0|nr:uncharacterized protein LOC110643631 isoform X1 [Hevea brasiliensis]